MQNNSRNESYFEVKYRLETKQRTNWSKKAQKKNTLKVKDWNEFAFYKNNLESETLLENNHHLILSVQNFINFFLAN